MNKIFRPVYNFVFYNKKMSVVWLVVRIYVGWAWLHAGYLKMVDPKWVGDTAGGALIGFVNGAVAKTGGAHPDVTMWYAWFLENVVLPNANLWSHMVAYGEFLVGLGLIVGLFTGVAAFFGAFMNMNFLLAGTVSANPVLLILSIFIIMARKIAGLIGMDYFIMKRRRGSLPMQ